MSKLSLLEISQSQLDTTPVIDGQLIVCLDTGNAYRDSTVAHVKIGSDLEVVSDLPLAPLAEKLYYLKPDKLYVFLGGNWTLLNDKNIDLDESIAKLPAGTESTLNDDVEIVTQDTDITQPHYYRRKLVVLWEYIKTKAQDFFAAKNHKHEKADITDFPTSMPASDVYPWAKAATKPSYTKAEVGLGKIDNTADADKSVKRATTAGTADSANSVAWENVKDKPTTFPVEAHNHDDRYYTESEVNTLLASKVHEETITDERDLNTVKTTGIYHLKTTNFTNGPGITNHGTLIVDYTVGTPYQIYIPDSKNQAFRRNYNNSSSVWNAWSELKLTDTNTWRGIQNNLTSDSTSDSLSAAQGKVLKGLVDGKLGKNDNAVSATTSKALQLLSSTRPTSMNFNLGSNDYKGKVTYAIASSSTTDGKPPIDSVVQNWSWDSNGYGAQVAVKADANPRMYIRGATSHNGASKWDANWKTVAFTDDAMTPKDHNHGLNSSSLAKTVDNETTNSWDMVGGNNCFLLRSLRMQSKAPDWLEGNYAAGIAFGGSDTKGVISHAYGSPAIKFAGGNGAAPVWWLRLTGTTGKTYNLDVMPKASAADSATTASKLSTSAGSVTQPVYFKDGVPVATTYTLNKTVPADAKFTDTNTWRGIQNNLTSDSADQSLSAAQGKVLKGLVDGKLGKNEKATSAATADKAAKLATARTVSGGTDITLSFNYDGSGNSNANIEFYNRNHTVQNTNNYPFHRFAKLDASKEAWSDKSMTFLINQDYSGGGYGICRLVYRSNADSSNASVAAEWLVRKGLSADSVQVAIKTDKTNGAYCDAFYKSGGTYNGCSIRALASGGRASQSRTWTLIGSMEASGTTTSDKKNSVECWKTIAEAGTALHNQAYSSSASAVDSGYVNSAGTSNSCTGNAATATGVKDYNEANRTIKIGYAGAGLTTSNLTHIAGYASNGNQIKNVSKTVLQDWIDLNGMINKLSEGTSDPQDNDYYISQYSGGGTTTTTYHRRPVKALWNYIKGKADGVYLKLTGGAISGRITRDSGGSWISSRDQVAVFGTKSGKDSFNPVVGQKTPKGAWAMGNLGENEQLCFGYTTDANYNAGSNNAVQVWLPAQAGTIITSATIGTQTVDTAKKVADSNDSTATTFAYSKSGMNYADYTWLAAWNGYELRAVNKSQFAQAHSHPYLPTAGGTMTGDITFSSIGDTATSKKITWNGSTDGASIYYQTTAKDQGNLVLNCTDDANCYIRIAYNGAFKSYFSPSDGNFHGNVNGKADTAGTADKANSVAWANVSGKPTIPAAAISASGSNYVRFSDGTQFAFGTTTMSKSNVSTLGGNDNFTYFNQLYGAAFKNNDYYLTVKFIKNLNSNAHDISDFSMIINTTEPPKNSTTWEQHSWRNGSGFHINKPSYNEYYPSQFSYYAVGKWK